MYCPECGAEYVEGIAECADCRVPLVAEIPPDAEARPKEYAKVLATFNQGDIAVLKSVLDDERVDYYFLDERFNQVDPWIQPPRLFVRKDHLGRVRDILGRMEVRFLGVSGS